MVENSLEVWPTPKSLIDALASGDGATHELAQAKADLSNRLAGQGLTGDDAARTADGLLNHFISMIGSGVTPDAAASEIRLLQVTAPAANRADGGPLEALQQALATGKNVAEALRQVTGGADTVDGETLVRALASGKPLGAELVATLQATAGSEGQVTVPLSAAEKLAAALAIGGDTTKAAIDSATAGMSPEHAAAFVNALTAALANGASAASAVNDATLTAQAATAPTVPMSPAAQLAAALAAGGAAAAQAVAAMTAGMDAETAATLASQLNAALAEGRSAADAAAAAKAAVAEALKAAIAAHVPLSDAARLVAALAQGNGIGDGTAVRALANALASGLSTEAAAGEGNRALIAEVAALNRTATDSDPLLAALASGKGAAEALAQAGGGINQAFVAALANALADGKGVSDARGDALARSDNLQNDGNRSVQVADALQNIAKSVNDNRLGTENGRGTELGAQTGVTRPSEAPRAAEDSRPSWALSPSPIASPLDPAKPSEKLIGLAKTNSATDNGKQTGDQTVKSDIIDGKSAPVDQTADKKTIVETTKTDDPIIKKIIIDTVKTDESTTNKTVDTPSGTTNTLPQLHDTIVTLTLSNRMAKTALGLRSPTDADGDPLSVTITGLPSKGQILTAEGKVVAVGTVLTASDLTGLSFAPGERLTGNLGDVSFSVSDGKGDSVAGKVTITLVAGNTAPIASGGATLATVDANAANPAGTTLTALFASHFSDSGDSGSPGGPDSFAGIAVVGNAATAAQGTWQYSVDGGGSWSALPTAVSSSNAVLLVASAQLRFVPASGFSGAAPGGLTVILADDSSPFANASGVNLAATGGSSVFSATTITLSTTVSATHQAPTASGNATLSPTSEDLSNPAGATVTSLFTANFTDSADAGLPTGADTLAGIAITGNTATSAQGGWQYSTDGSRWTTIDTSLSESTALTLTAAARLRFLPAADWNGTPGSLTAHLIDSQGTVVSGQTVSLSERGATGGNSAYSVGTVSLSTTVTAVNDAPVASGDAILGSVNEDTDAGNIGGNSVTGLFSGAFSDAADAVTGGSQAGTLAGIALIGNGASSNQGQWQYSNDGGHSWTTVSNTLSNSAALILSNTALLRFVPVANWNGNPGTLSARLLDSTAVFNSGDIWDVSANGGSTAISANTVSLSTSVTAVNDAPVASGSTTAFSTSEDTASPAGSTVSGLFAANFSDAADNIPGGSSASTLAGVVVIANAATTSQGTWQYSADSGATWTTVSTSLSASSALVLLNAAQLRFVPAANWNGNAGVLTTRLLETTTALTTGSLIAATTYGGTSQLSAATLALAATVAAINDAPIASGAATLTAVNEDTASPAGATVSALFAANFSDTADDVTGGSTANTLAGIAIVGNGATAATQGVWEYSADGGTTWTTISSDVSAAAPTIVRSDALLHFKPVTDYNGTPGSLTVRLIDSSITVTNGAGTDLTTAASHGGTTAYSDNTVTLGTSITAVNDAPTLNTGIHPTFSALTADTTAITGKTISSLISGSSFADVDGTAASAIAVTGQDSGTGTWKFSTDNGGTWSNASALSNSNALLLDAAHQLAFIPTSGWSGTTALTFHAWDKTSGTAGTYADASTNGGTSAFSSGTETAYITVSPNPSGFPVSETTGSTWSGWTTKGDAYLDNGTVVLTEAENSQSGTIVYNSALDLRYGVHITFNYYSGDGSGADGFSFYMIDGSVATPTEGGVGGALGYGYGGASPGVTKGYMGIGFDTYGNFSNSSFWGNGSGPGEHPNSIAIRGSSTGATSSSSGEYRFLTGSYRSVTSITSNTHHINSNDQVKVDLTLTADQHVMMLMSWDQGSTWYTIYNNYDFGTNNTNAGGTVYDRPDTVKLGFAASTGGANDLHTISNLSVSLPTNNAAPVTDGDHALNFNGTSSVVTAGHTAALAPTSALTVEAWVKLTATAAGAVLVSKMDGTGSAQSGYQLTLDSTTGKNAHFGIANGGNVTSIIGSTGLDDGAWHHIAATYDNSALRLYVDGNLDATGSLNNGLGSSSGNLTIGNNGTGSAAFNGSINDVQVWGSARTASELTADGSHRLVGNENNLAAYWKFDETSGSTALGSAPGTPSATIANGSYVNLDDITVTSGVAYKGMVLGYSATDDTLSYALNGTNSHLTSYSAADSSTFTYTYNTSAASGSTDNFLVDVTDTHGHTITHTVHVTVA